MQKIEAPKTLLIKYHQLTRSENDFKKSLNLKPDDGKLWEELSGFAGSYSAFKKILFRYSINVHELAQRFIKSKKIADHIAKETFSALYIKRIDLTACELKTFFLQEIKEKVYDQLARLLEEWKVKEVKTETEFYAWAARRKPDKDRIAKRIIS